MRKLPITVFAAHWLFFSGLIQAQVPSGNIDVKASAPVSERMESKRKTFPGAMSPGYPLLRAPAFICWLLLVLWTAALRRPDSP